MLARLFRETDSIVIVRECILRMKADKAFEAFRPSRWVDFLRLLEPAKKEVRRRILGIKVASLKEQAVRLIIEAVAVSRNCKSQEHAHRAGIEPASFGKDFDSRLKRTVQKQFGSPRKQMRFAWVHL